MALSGSFSGSIVSGHYKLQVDWSATQNITNNTSKITAVMYLVNDYKLIISGRSDNSTSIAGTAQTWSSPSINGTGTTKLGTVTSGDIAHNADGTKSVTISATFYVRATLSGTYYEKITASATVTLNTIPRATTPTFHASSLDMGDTLTIYTARASTSFKHDLAYSFAGSDWETFATDVDTWHAWKVPDLATSIPNATSGTMTIRCITKNGGTTIGTKTAMLTVKVPADYVPVVDRITITEAVNDLASQFGTFVQNKSKFKVSITASGVKGSTIKSYQATLQGKTYKTSAFTSDVITGSGAIGVAVTVTDSRGRTSEPTGEYVVVANYSPPKIQALSCYRCDANGNAADNGEYAAVNLQYSVSPLNNGNMGQVVCSIKKTTDPDTSYEELFTRSALSGNITVKPKDATFSTDNQFTIRVVVSDWFGSEAAATATAILPSGAVILDILANGKGLAFGKTADKEGVDFGWSPKGAVLGLGEASRSIPANGDLNDYITPGVYAIRNNATAQTLINAPDTTYAGTLRVYSAVGDVNTTGPWVYILQEYRPYAAAEPTFLRSGYTNSTSQWSFSDWTTFGGVRNYTVTWESDVTTKGYSLSREGNIVCFNAQVSVKTAIGAGVTRVIGTIPEELRVTSVVLGMGRQGVAEPASVAIRPNGELIVTPTNAYAATASIFFTLTWNTAAAWK